jgi:hypothetical protein
VTVVATVLCRWKVVLVLGRRDQADLAVQASVVEPVDALGDGALEVVDALDAELLADPLQRPGPGRRVTPGVDRQPGRPLPQLVGLLPRCRHDSHPHVD